MFGRVDMCDFLLEHPTISRFHAGKYSDSMSFLIYSFSVSVSVIIFTT